MCLDLEASLCLIQKRKQESFYPLLCSNDVLNSSVDPVSTYYPLYDSELSARKVEFGRDACVESVAGLQNDQSRGDGSKEEGEQCRDRYDIDLRLSPLYC